MKMLRSSLNHQPSYFAADYGSKPPQRTDLLDKVTFESTFGVSGSAMGRVSARESFFGSITTEPPRGAPTALDRMPSSSMAYSAKMDASSGFSNSLTPSHAPEPPRTETEDARRGTQRDETSALRPPMEMAPPSRSVIVEEQEDTVEADDLKNGSDRESDPNGSDAMNGPMLAPFQTFNNKINEAVEEWFQTASKFAESFDQHRHALSLISSKATQEVNSINRKRRLAFSAMEELRTKFIKQSAGTDADAEQGDEGTQDYAEDEDYESEDVEVKR